MSVIQQRDRLVQIRERTHDAREARARARKQLDLARGAEDHDAIAISQLAYDEADTNLTLAERLESQLLGQLAGVNGNSYGRGESIFNDPQTIQTLERLGNGSFPIGAVNLGPLSTREELVQRINTGSWGQPKLSQATGDVTVPDSARLGTYYGIVPQLRRPLSLLDIIPTAPMDGRSFGYMQETGSLDDAREVVEAELKPATDVVLTEQEVTAATIAVFTKLKRQQLADTASLSQTINERLVYQCLRRLENQVLAGDGVGENILGILNHPIGSVVFDAASALSDLTLDGIVSVIDADATPDAVVLNPADWAGMLKAKAAGSGVRLDSDGMFSSPPNTAWGLPVVTAKVLPQSTALVGAFGTCARLFIREPVNVRASDSDADDFTRNRVTALGELRAGLAVWSALGFTKVALA